MKKKTKLLQRSENIYDFLNSTQGDSANPFGEFIEDQTRVFNRVFDEKEDNDISEAVIDTWKLAFALGYAIGNESDIIDPGILKDVVAIKQAIQDKELLPYMPRGKKAA